MGRDLYKKCLQEHGHKNICIYTCIIYTCMHAYKFWGVTVCREVFLHQEIVLDYFILMAAWNFFTHFIII